MHCELDDWKLPVIKVIGIGGAGVNAVNRMIQIGIPGVDFIAVDTDAQALSQSEAPCKIQIGVDITRSLGAGGGPTIGARSARESRERLDEILADTDMVFVAAGMGGGTGTGAAPIVCQLAQARDVLTIAVVAKPFSFEGPKRLAAAEEGIKCLGKRADTLIVVRNDRLLEVVKKDTSLEVAFRIGDEVLRQGVQGISEVVTQPGLINLDFADVKSVMNDAGEAYISMGYGEGRERSVDAAKMALGNPILDIESIQNASGLLVDIRAGEDLTLAEVDQAMRILSQAANPQAQIIVGTAFDPRMSGRVQITLIAAGFSVDRPAVSPPKESSAREEVPSMSSIPDDDLAVPAFMRYGKRVRVEGVSVA